MTMASCIVCERPCARYPDGNPVCMRCYVPATPVPTVKPPVRALDDHLVRCIVARHKRGMGDVGIARALGITVALVDQALSAPARRTA